MHAIELRPASAADADQIARIWHDGWHDGHSGHVPEALHEYRRLDDFRQRVPERLATTTVAVAGDGLAGFVTVVDDELEQLYVDGSHRGGAVAGALIQHAEQTIARRYPVAWLAVVAGNARARRFYERHGWRDAAAFDYPAETASGTFPVPSRRYEKRVTAG